MRNKRKQQKIFSGWWTVIASGITGFWGVGYYHYGLAALFKPISSELGFTRAETSLPSAIGRLQGGFEAPLSGWISDRYGPRWIAVFGIFMFGLSLFLMQYVNSLWSFILIWGIMLGTSSNLYTNPINTALANWFVKKRGLAMSIKRTLDGLSGVLVLPLIVWLILRTDWRTACLIGGIVMWLVPLPLVLFTVKQHRPEYYGSYPDGVKADEKTDDTHHMIQRGIKYAAEVEEVEFTVRQAMKTPSFWLLLLAGGCNYLAFPTINIHGIPFLTDIGFNEMEAGGMISLMVMVSIPLRIIGGFLADRVSRRRIRLLVTTAYILQCLGFGIYLISQARAAIYVWFVLYGIGIGISYSLYLPLQARYFGRKAFGSIHGISEMIMTPVGIAAPIYAGWVWDTTGSYITAFTLVTILLGIAAFIMLFTKAPKHPLNITDVTQLT